jgi:hypothetical protein
MIDNSAQIRPMLSFDDKDDFYFVQIFKRRKDNPTLGKDQIVIGNFYIDSFDDYDEQIPRIINLCEAENARAYFRINKRNYKALAPHFLERISKIIFTKDCRAIRKTFDAIAGEFHYESDKKWIVDVDNDKNVPFGDLCDTLTHLQKESKRTALMIHIPTKNGLHIITRPFNLKKFTERFPTIDVHRDNPTLLYCP